MDKPTDPPPRGKDSRDSLLDAFAAPVTLARVPLLYRAGLFVVALAMVLLPLVYFALIIGVAWLTWQHAAHNTFLLGGRGRTSSLFLYLAPILAGLCLILFMIKPIFAKQAKQPKRFRLEREREPLLFAFVEKVAAAVGAPAPKEILMDCEVNASASFRKGVLSFLGSDLTLTLGLPLVAGLSLRQLAGVLAHEFGHFSQGTGMRLTYVIRSVNFWFARVVYDRDVFDEKLVAWSKEGDFRIMILLWTVRFFVWLTRRVLWVLMMAGHAISCFALRQMEFDADRYETRLAGSDSFEQTAMRLRVLALAAQAAHADLGASWTEKRLGDDLAQLVVSRVGALPKNALDATEQAAREAKTGLFDTHPADADRIRNARTENAPGVFRAEVPATMVFGDFEAVAREVTLHFYRDVVGLDVNAENLVPSHELARRQLEVDEAFKAMRRYFQNRIAPLSPPTVFGPGVGTGEAPAATPESLREARARMEEALPGAGEPFARMESAQDRLLKGLQAAALFGAGFTIKKNADALPTSAIEAEAVIARSRADIKTCESELANFRALCRTRLWAAFSLLRNGPAASVAGAEDLRGHLERYLVVERALETAQPVVLQLRDEFVALAVLVGQLSAGEQPEALVPAIRTRMTELVRLLSALRAPLLVVPYPFPHARKDISVGEHLVERSPDDDNLQSVYETASACVDRYVSLQGRILGRLAQIAETVEGAMGLPRQVEPPEKQP